MSNIIYPYGFIFKLILEVIEVKSIKQDSKTKRKIRELIANILHENPKFLKGKSLVFCKRKGQLSTHENVAVFVKQMSDKPSKTFTIYFSNISFEYNALFFIKRALEETFNVKYISIKGRECFRDRYAVMEIML